MAKPNYKFEKRRKELERKKKKELKKERKLEQNDPEEVGLEQNTGPDEIGVDVKYRDTPEHENEIE